MNFKIIKFLQNGMKLCPNFTRDHLITHTDQLINYMPIAGPEFKTLNYTALSCCSSQALLKVFLPTRAVKCLSIIVIFFYLKIAILSK